MIDEIHNAYLALELEPGAALPQVQEAWREQVTVWHPDRFSGNPKLQRKAQERTKDINAAYDILKQFLKDSSTPHLRPEVAGEPPQTAASRSQISPGSSLRQKPIICANLPNARAGKPPETNRYRSRIRWDLRWVHRYDRWHAYRCIHCRRRK